MIQLNDNAIEYMQRQGFCDIVLNVEEYKTWCDPPRLEMSVGFADTDSKCGSDSEYGAGANCNSDTRHDSGSKHDSQDYMEHGYSCDESVLGKVYIPSDKVEISGPITIRYEKHPWIERFEVDGIKILKPRRTGYGTKNVRAFVQSLNTIYAAAFDDYLTFCNPQTADSIDNSCDNSPASTGNRDGFDASAYFAHVAEFFVQEFEDDQRAKMFGKFCGFVENMWREGDRQSHDVAMNAILPIIRRTAELEATFGEHITEEFAEYIHKYSID